jgi:UDP-N-acetylmuramoylalanine--D-glutamate ligase
MRSLVVIGAGESGVGAAVLAKTQGLEVWVSDAGKIQQKYVDMLNGYQIDYEEESHSENHILSADEIVKSPGIPDNIDILKMAKSKGIPIVSEIEFAARYTDAKMICITGSNGKTTTTLLTYHILKNAGLNVGLAGNVGESFALQVAQNTFDYYVLELSSFQLDGMYDFKADVAVLLNITPDHLDRYEYDFNKYVNSKFRIVQNLTENDYFIYCADDVAICNEIEQRKLCMKKIPFSLNPIEKSFSVFKNENNIVFNLKNCFDMAVKDLSLPGSHNVYNSMAAGAIAQVLSIKKETIRERLMDFKNVEHRLEPVIQVHGIEFINDSKATNVNSAWYALESMTKPVVWILGGVDKGNDYSIMMDIVRQKVKAIVCIGVDNAKIHQAFDGVIDIIVDTDNMKDAVNSAYYLAKPNETVLLSPACASFDLFENYEDRGQQFKAAVRNL